MTDIDKLAREIAEQVLAARITPLIGKDYKNRIPFLKQRIAAIRSGTSDGIAEVQAARLGILAGMEKAAGIAKDQKRPDLKTGAHAVEFQSYNQACDDLIQAIRSQANGC